MDGLKLQGCNPGLVVASAGDHRRRRGPQQRRRGHVHAVGDVRPPRARLQRRAGHHRPRRQHGGVRHAPGLPARVHGRGRRTGADTIAAGSPYPLTFKADNGYRGLDIATKDNPYTRQVDCTTLKTVTPGQTAITPRPVPVPAVTRSGTALSVAADGDVHLPVADRRAWGNTCREFVLTDEDGRAAPRLFKFLAATHASTGASPTTVLNYANPVANDAVTLAFRQVIAASDALRSGSYSKTLTLTLSTTEP